MQKKLVSIFIAILYTTPLLSSSLELCPLSKAVVAASGMLIREDLTQIEAFVPHSSSIGKTEGGNNSGLQRAKLGQKDVFLKSINILELGSTYEERLLKEFLSEAENNRLMSELGYAPHFFGIKYAGEGNMALVSELKFPSWFVKYDGYDQLGIALKKVSPDVRKAWSDRLKFIMNDLNQRKLGIRDLQVLLLESGELYLIDFGIMRPFDGIGPSEKENNKQLNAILDRFPKEIR